MALRGRAFLPMWWGVAPGFEREFDRFHTIEHMPERLGIPGFLRGRRYMGVENPRRVFQIYEGTHIEIFRSPGYLARLNAPTDWSNRVQPGFVDFIRGACEGLVSLGEGVGGNVLTARFVAAEGDPSEAAYALAVAAPAIARLHGVTGVHAGRHRPEITRIETAETRLRPAAAPPAFDFILLVEGIGASELEEASAQIVALATIPGARLLETERFRLAYLLEHEG